MDRPIKKAWEQKLQGCRASRELFSHYLLSICHVGQSCTERRDARTQFLMSLRTQTRTLS